MKKFIRILMVIFLCLYLIPTIHGASFEGYKKIDSQVADLKESSTDIGRASYLSKVGGIAFNQTASPEMEVNSIELNYDATQADGQRLTAVINGTKVAIPLYDWVLIPIFLYSDTPYYACFSLFGTTGNTAKDNQIKKQEKVRYLASYHPNFKNTLVGLRLMQMDSILTASNFTDLPLNNPGGEIIFGAGEESLWEQRNADSYDQFLDLITGYGDGYYNAYVISDYQDKVNIGFGIKDGVLQLSGRMYIYFWKAQSREKLAQIMADAKKTLAKKYDVTFTGNSIKGYDNDKMKQAVAEYNDIQDHAAVIFLEDFSDDVYQNIELVRQANPVVYEAVNDVMRFSAFFRYCKTNNPKNWLSVKTKIQTIKPAPKVTTFNAAR
ncbi:MAG: hypothetical protein K6U80_18790 [Firmicutes bacterium]|nr:hypothetical protein [Bacillota bacterium]